MLLSTLKGWAEKRPTINLDGSTSFLYWKKMKHEVKDWIDFYQDTSVSDNMLNDKNYKPMHGLPLN